MNKSVLFSILVCGSIFIGCNKEQEPNPDPNITNGKIELVDGAIIINNNPDVSVTGMNKLLDRSEGKSLKSSIKATDKSDFRAHDYRFKLVAEMGTMNITNEGVDYKVQATHVKISDDGYAFVAYNNRGTGNVGGIVVYKYTVTDGTMETVKVDVKAIQSIEMRKAQINSIDFDGNKLYLAGASEETKFGYQDDGNVAFFMVMELDANKKFKPETPFIKQLTSFQATSIRKYGNRIYITTGDGTEGTEGGLYIYDANNYLPLTPILGMEHVRSVDVDDSGVYLFQANHARVTQFDLSGNLVKSLYEDTGEAWQRDAKSEILVWKDYLFVAEDESGLRMLDKTGKLIAALDRPGNDPETEVTNSVCMNSDIKKNASGKTVQTDLLLLANGECGVYWYDVITDPNGDDRIVAAEKNSILGGVGSANFITSKGNIVFVADGLAGLKVLYIAEEDEKWDCSNSFSHHTFIKDNGNDHGDPYTRKVGDVFIVGEGENLTVYIYSLPSLPEGFIFVDDNFEFFPNVKTVDLKKAGVIFGPSLEYFDGIKGLLTGGPCLYDKNVNNGTMSDMNAKYRTTIQGGVKFTFPKDELIFDDEGNIMCIVYSGNGAWGYGNPQGPSGATGTGANNNGQIIVLNGVSFCELIK